MARSTTPRAASEPITMGHIRGHGCRDLLVYCVSPWCNHSAKRTLDWLAVDTVLLDLDGRMVCTACGWAAAMSRPDWTPHTSSALERTWRSLLQGKRICR